MSDPRTIQPPQWPLKLLRFFVRKEFLEEIEGDMEEIFQENLDQYSVRKARTLYTLDILKLFRPVLLKNISQVSSLNQISMFRNYTKVSVRNLMKNPLSSFINLFGLSVAIGISLVVYAFLEYDYNIDQFHKNKNEVYLTVSTANRDGELQQYGLSPRPLGEMLQQDFPAIKKMCRVEDGTVVMKYNDNVFHERVRYVDPEFLDMFTFPLKWGAASSLKDLNSIILSEDMSIKYFGDENPVGRDVLVIFNDQNKKVFTITGVAKEFPKSRAIDFNFLINFKNLETTNPEYNTSDWKKFVSATIIQVNNPADLNIIISGMEKYRKLQNDVQKDWPVASFSFVSLADLHREAAHIQKSISYDQNVEGRIGMPIVAIFMLVLACFNYINIAITSAAKRLKEIGVRKVIGASRTKVVVQFLTENVVVTCFALLFGVVLGAFIFIPWFVQFSGWPLELRLINTSLWIFMGGLVLFTGLASGIYPAFYISKFEAVKIFKGSLEFGRKNPLTKVFLGVQLVLACMTMTAAVVFTQNNSYQYNRPWGYNQKQALYVSVPDLQAFTGMRDAMAQNSNVVSLSGAADHIGKSVSTTVLHLPPDRQYEVNQLAVDEKYFETLGLTLLQGRNFNKQGDKQAVIVNELLVKNLGWDEPLGQQFEIDSVKYEVIGVVKDFHTRDFFSKKKPTAFTVAHEKDFRYLALRVKSGSEQDTHTALQQQWAKLYPEIPFQGGHQEDVWTNFYFSVDRSKIFNNVLATIAVMLASLGLYGLVTLNVSGRVREFSIRKTLGAGLKHIAGIIIKQYAWLTIIALLVGAPISYLFAQAYLDMLFAYPMPMTYLPVMLAIVLLVIVLLAVVSTQITKVAKTNPVEGLKVE